MQLSKPYSLHSKFLVGLTLASLVIGGVLFGGFYFHMRQVLEAEVVDKASIILAQVDAVQGYVRRTLRPKMFKELPNTFLIEAMSSSYISRNVMDRMNLGPEQPLYRRVAVGARNPKYEANALEFRLIETFRQNPEMTVTQGYESINGVTHFIMARPVVFKRSCMRCHGEPNAAPIELVNKYGNRGFKHELDSIDGIDFVGLPVSASVARIQGTIMTFMVVFAAASLLFFGAVNLLFKRIVVDNFRSLATSFRRNFSDDRGTALIREVEQGDEIDGMIAGVEKLGDHLYDTRKKLQEYAANLENMVEERTKELALQADERQSDVELFVRLLSGSSKSQSRPELWRMTLPFIAERFDLEKTTFVCTTASHRHYTWPETDEQPELPEDWVGFLTSSEPLIEGARAFVPVESVRGSTDGVLCLYHKPDRCFRDQDKDVLKAIGRQLGIAAEHLVALDNILRHNANLQAIFEGISDPLLLADAAGNPIMVNTAARTLGRQLSGDVATDGNILPFLCGNGDAAPDCKIAEAVQAGRFVSREVTVEGGRSFSLGIYPVLGEEEKVSQLVIYVHETTRHKRLLSQMTQSEKMATVGKLASGLAHEINNPLGVILCYAELLRKGAVDDGQRDDIDVIVKHTRRAQNVLRDLLNFARPKVATDTAVDLTAVTESVVDVFRVQAEKKHASIAVSRNGSIPPILVEAQVVEHILANLLLNALDAVPKQDGRIDVSLAYDRRDDSAVLHVADNGPGVPEDQLQHVFDPFFTTKDVDEGTGLGLAVVFGFISDLGGAISVGNRPQGGADFELRFPVLHEEGTAT